MEKQEFFPGDIIVFTQTQTTYMLVGVKMPKPSYSTEYKADFYSLQHGYVIRDHHLFSDNFGFKFDVYRDGKKLDKL